MSLRFDPNKYEIRTMEDSGLSVTFRAFENIVYVDNPVDTRFQSMNIYIPERFYNDEEINGYTLRTAPILFENNVGGFFPSEPRRPEHEMFGHTSTAFYALLHGYVVATPGARGRVNRAEDGTYYGKGQAGIVDLKAALRYLWFNADSIPGNINRIFSNGASAGGCLSALLGCYDNDAEYAPYLKAIGAAEADGRLFAASCYCPVTDLEHADLAYEWQFAGIPDFHRMHMRMDEGGRPQFSAVDGVMSEKRIALSGELAALFPAYLNSLALVDQNGEDLTLNEDGSGSFKEYIIGLLASSAQGALDRGENAALPGIQIKGGKVSEIDFEAYMKGITRMKAAPPFDDVTMDNFENNLFGDETHDCAHFTSFSFDRSEADDPLMASEEVIRMMNPLNYMKPGSRMTQHWRFRQGTDDRDIGFATPAILALTLKKLGLDVDFGLTWKAKHGGDFDLPDLFAWIDCLCKE